MQKITQDVHVMPSAIAIPGRDAPPHVRTRLIPERVAGHVSFGSLGSVFVAYLLVTSAVAVWLPVPEIARAALALPALALIPLLVGSALLRFLPILPQTAALDGFGRALVEWLVGSLTLFVLSVVLLVVVIELLF